MEHRNPIIPSSSLVPLFLAAADGITNSSAASTDLSYSGDISIPLPPMTSVNTTPLFPQDQLMKFLATIGALDAPSPDLINPTVQLWNQLSDGLSELHQLPSLPSSDLPLVFSGDSWNERFSATPFPAPLLPPPLPSSNQKGNQKGKAMMKRKLEQRRRSKIADRICVLKVMMPGGEKMNTVTLLEELPKYIKYLEAQLTAMQPMSSTHSGFSPGPFYPSDLASAEAIGGLGRLNSPMVLCKNGCCVTSAEQAATLRLEQMLLPEPDSTVGDWRAREAKPKTTIIGDVELNHGTGVVKINHDTGHVMQDRVLCDIDRAGNDAPEGNSVMLIADASARA